MERLSIDEVIEHCNKTCDMTEKIAKARGHELESIESKQFWEHYQVREWLKELKAYRDAEEKGLLLRLSVAIGDIVYRINEYADNPIIPMGVISIEIKGVTDTFKEMNCKECVFGGEFIYRFTDIGKTVFLTKEEAEQKLASMQKGE